MTAYGYKQTCGQVSDYVRFTPVSGHSEAQERGGLKKRTLDVRLTPNSGLIRVWRGMSAYDPGCVKTIFEARARNIDSRNCRRRQ